METTIARCSRHRWGWRSLDSGNVSILPGPMQISRLLFLGVHLTSSYVEWMGHQDNSPRLFWEFSRVWVCCMSRVKKTRSVRVQRAVPMGSSGLTGEIGESGEGGALKGKDEEPKVGEGEGMIGVRAGLGLLSGVRCGPMSLAAGLGLGCCSRLRVTL